MENLILGIGIAVILFIIARRIILRANMREDNNFSARVKIARRLDVYAGAWRFSHLKNGN